MALPSLTNGRAVAAGTIVAAYIAASTSALAQSSNQNGNSGHSAGPSPTALQPSDPMQLPKPLPGLGGVPAQLPGPLGVLGGVPAQLPGPQGGKGSLLDRPSTLPVSPTTPAQPPSAGLGVGAPGYMPMLGLSGPAPGWWAPTYSTGSGVVVVGPIDPFLRDGLLGVKPMQEAVDSAAGAKTDTRPTLDRAEEAYRTGDLSVSLALFQEYVSKNPDDAAARRLQGLALIDAGKLIDGVDTVFAAYASKPKLARDPLRPGDLRDGSGGFADRRGRVLGLASRTGGAPANFVGAVLAQGEGRNELAAKLLDRAVKAGLVKAVADEFQATLAPLPPKAPQPAHH